jgi:CHASE1-domain containing sensor protein
MHFSRPQCNALDTGEPSATGLLRLMQEKEKQKGIIVLMPVYRKGMPLTNAAERQQAIMGDTAAVFRGADLIAGSLAAEGFMLMSSLDLNIGISVYASETPGAENLLFRSGSSPETIHSSVGLPDWLFYNQPAPYRHTFDVAGQKWHMVVSTPPTWFVKSDATALWGFLAGLLFSIGGAVYLQTVLDRSRRIGGRRTHRTIAPGQ